MLANVITATRIAAAGAMLASCPASPAFWLLYAWCGVSDMVDGPIARKLGEESPFGARLDSAADLAFATACCFSLLPECEMETWLIALVVLLAAVKLLLYAILKIKGNVEQHAHSMENRAAGLAVFLTLPALYLSQTSAFALPACILSAYSTLQEGRAAFAGQSHRNEPPAKH